MDIPDFITHYHSAEDPPFRNLSEVPEEDRGSVISMLVARRRNLAGFHRIFGLKYIPMRLATEEKLRSLFVAAGGRPQRLAPHYFVLGASKWFEGLYPSARKVVISLADLDPATTSITYPDSFVSMRLGPNYGVPPEVLRPYHERAFLLSDLPDLIAKYGIPADQTNADYSNYGKEPFEKYIEVQVWADAPVMKFVSSK